MKKKERIQIITVPLPDFAVIKVESFNLDRPKSPT